MFGHTMPANSNHCLKTIYFPQLFFSKDVRSLGRPVPFLNYLDRRVVSVAEGGEFDFSLIAPQSRSAD